MISAWINGIWTVTLQKLISRDLYHFWMKELLGYQHFFLWIMVCCAATFGVTALLKIDPEFGKKQTE